MKRRFQVLIALLLSALLFGCVAACGVTNAPDAQQKDGFYLYFRDATSRELHPVEAVLDNTLSFDTRLSSVWLSLIGGGDRSDYTSPVPQGLSIKNYALNEQNLIFNFSAAYGTLSVQQEVLLRASLVKTFTQFPEVSTVEIRVEDQPLSRADGSYVGPEKAADFVDLLGSGLNAYAEASVTFYYTNEPGDCLIPLEEEVRYSNAVPLEQAIVEKLISGPSAEGYYRTLPAELNLLSVSTRGGVCYVNFDSAILKELVVSKPEIAVYSIVNTLSGINGISAVQISVNGSTNVSVMEQVDLSKPLYRTSDYDEPEKETLQETGTEETSSESE